MSLTPCKFYGTSAGCRYGNNCRFYHASGPIQPGTFGRSSFGMPPQQDTLNLTGKSQQNMEAMIEMVKRDMQEWESCHIYPFSCYGPSGGKPNVPGFEDISTEELRYRFLIVNNKMPVDLSKETAALQQARQAYRQVTPEIRNILERVIVKGERISGGLGSQSLGGFGGSALSTPVSSGMFGGGAFSQPQQSTAFGQPSTVFGSGQQQNVFGGSGTTAGAGSSLFGQTTNTFGSPSTFGTSQTSGSIFGGGNASTLGQPSTLFGGASTNQSNTTSSPFVGGGQTQSMFGGGGGTTPQNLTTFGGGASSIFGSPPVSTTPAFGATGSSLFGGTQASSNMFGQQQPQQSGGLFSSPASVPANAGIFGNSQNTGTQQQSSIFGQPVIPVQPQPQAQITSTAPSLFGQQSGTTISSSPFGQSNQPTQLSIQPQPQQQQQIGFGAFSQPAGQTGSSLFGGTSGADPSALTSQAPPTAAGLPASGSFFGTLPVPGVTGGSLFGSPQQQSPFGQQSTLFGTAAQVPTTTIIDEKYIYSNESDLTPEELEAFRAPSFTLENIPIRPPPKSLCQ